MKSIIIFRDLELEIEMINARMEDLEREDYAIDRIQFNKIDLENYVSRKHKINNEMAILQSILEDKKQTKEELICKLDQLEGLEYQIAYKRFIEGKDLYQISNELNYSYKYIKNLSHKASRKIKSK